MTAENQQAPGADAIGASCLFLRHWPRGSGAALATMKGRDLWVVGV